MQIATIKTHDLMKLSITYRINNNDLKIKQIEYLQISKIFILLQFPFFRGVIVNYIINKS
jgi:hypothetical protein